MTPLDFGICGVGSVGFHHARILAGLPGVRLLGIHDRDAPRAKEVARRLELTAYAELDRLLEDVDGLVIAVPTADHAGLALRALERGVHLLVEKPLAHSLQAADRILEAAHRHGLIVQTGHVERFNAAVRAAEPYLTEPLFVEGHRLAPFGPRGTDVAVVLDLMIHDVDLVLSLMRRPVTAVAATGVPVLTPSPDIANARLEFEGGGVANLTASRVSRERLRKLRIFQPSGYLSLDLARGSGELLRLRPGYELEPGRPLSADGIDEALERVPLEGDGREPLRCELEAFVAAVRGERPVVVSGDDGRRALAVALEIIERIQEHVASAHPT